MITFVLSSIMCSAQIIPTGDDYLIMDSGDTIWVKEGEVRGNVIVYENAQTGQSGRIKKSEVIKMRLFDPQIYNLRTENGQVEYQEVIEVPGESASALYQKGRLWFADTYKNSKEVLELDDSANGVLVGTGWAELVYNIQLYITTKIEVKEGKYRYTINNMEIKIPASSVSARYETTLGDYWDKKKNRTIRKSILFHLQAHIDSLKAAMSTAQKTDDW